MVVEGLGEELQKIASFALEGLKAVLETIGGFLDLSISLIHASENWSLEDRLVLLPEDVLALLLTCEEASCRWELGVRLDVELQVGGKGIWIRSFGRSLD